MTERKIIYVSHPLRPAVSSRRQHRAPRATCNMNICETTEICLRLIEDYPDYLILSPVHAFSFVEPLSVGKIAEAVLAQCRRLLELADEVWVYGDYKTSEGCQMEIAYAESLGKSVVYSG